MRKKSNLVGAVFCFAVAFVLIYLAFRIDSPAVRENFSVVIIPKSTPTPVLVEISVPPLVIVVIPNGDVVATIESTPETLTQNIFQEIPNVVVYEVPTETPTVTMFQYTPSEEMIQDTSFTYTQITPFPTTIQVPADMPVSEDYLLSYTLDEMWDTAESMGLVDRISLCSGLPTPPYVTWEMAYSAAGEQTSDRNHTEIKMLSSIISRIVSTGGAIFPVNGVVQVSEETVKSKLVELYMQGSLHACMENNHPTLFGPGIQYFLDWLQEYIVSA
mgnify:CR=1 FL=1